jgi:phosphatidylglycerol:prolipoprotein diacylglycerol transferase
LADAAKHGNECAFLQFPNMFLADYLHNLNPIVFEFTSWLKIHWYGLAYVMGFVCGYWCLVYLARKGIGVLQEKELADFITYAAIFGVLLGGRLGYMLFYVPTDFFHDPLSLFKLQNGGMASHGGILGLFFFTLYYAIKHKHSWPGVGDNLVCVAPLGLLFGRLANFVNGELWGVPIKDGSPFAVRFPTELREIFQSDPSTYQTILSRLPSLPEDTLPDALITATREQPEVAKVVYDFLPSRHPSQLYEGALEGLALFAILMCIRLKFPKAPHGMLTGLFFLFYAAFRIYIEAFYRVGDGQIFGLARGLFYSLFMIGIGIAFLIFASRKKQLV